MLKSKSILEDIISHLKKKASPIRSQQKERYFKNVIKFYGIDVPALSTLYKDYSSVLKDMLKENNGKPEIRNLVYDLFVHDYAESKWIGIEIMSKVLQNKNCKLNIEDLQFVEKLFDEKLAYDWGTVDCLSSKVITNIIKNERESSIEHMLEWSKSENLWKRRASCVSFVKIARFGEHNDNIIQICKNTLQCSERFAQLGAGWVLRELYLADNDLVVSFLKDHYQYISREALRYAIEKMDSTLRYELLNHNKKPTKKRKRGEIEK